MMHTVFNILLSSVVISLSAWLSGKKPALAGFILAFPLATLIALPMSRAQYSDPGVSFNYAKSIFFAVPITMVFFIPFLLAEKMRFGFWTCYSSGILLLALGYFVQRWITQYF